MIRWCHKFFAPESDYFSEKRLILFTAEDYKRQKEFETKEGEAQKTEQDKWTTYEAVETARTNSSSHAEKQLRSAFGLGWIGNKESFLTRGSHQLAYRYVAEIKDLQAKKKGDMNERFRRLNRELFKWGSEDAIFDRKALIGGLANANRDLKSYDDILLNSYDKKWTDPPGAYQKIKPAETSVKVPKTPEDIAKMSGPELRRYWSTQSKLAIDYKIIDSADTLSQYGLINPDNKRTNGEKYYLHCAKTMRKAIKVLEERKKKTDYLENKKSSLDYTIAKKLLIGMVKPDGSKVEEKEALKYIDHIIKTGTLDPDHKSIVEFNKFDSQKEERDWQRRLQGRVWTRKLFNSVIDRAPLKKLGLKPLGPRGEAGRLINEANNGLKVHEEMTAATQKNVDLSSQTVKMLKEESKPGKSIIPGAHVRFEFNPMYEKEFQSKLPRLTLAALQNMEVESVNADSISFKSLLDNGKTKFTIHLKDQTLEVKGEVFPLNKYLLSEPKILKDQKEKLNSSAKQIARTLLENLKKKATADEMKRKTIHVELDLSDKGEKGLKNELGIGWAVKGPLSLELSGYDNNFITLLAKPTTSGYKEKTLRINIETGELEGGSHAISLSKALENFPIKIKK